MKSTIYFVVLSITLVSARLSPGVEDHLSPCDPSLRRYFTTLRESLSLGKFDGGSAVFVPAFGQESAIGIKADAHGTGDFSVTVLKPARSLFQATAFGQNPKAAASVPIAQSTVAVSAELGRSMTESFKNMLLGSKRPREFANDSAGNVSAYNAEATIVVFFFNTRGGVACGQTTVETELPTVRLFLDALHDVASLCNVTNPAKQRLAGDLAKKLATLRRELTAKEKEAGVRKN